MSEIPLTARVVIIGGGAVGVSALYHLARAGWRDCLLLEKNELTSGSTWHAAGDVPTFSISWSIMHMQRYSAELYRQLSTAVGYPIDYHVTGSLRLAHIDVVLTIEWGRPRCPLPFDHLAGGSDRRGDDLGRIWTPHRSTDCTGNAAQ
ncbi:MAG TPA: FAD-binding oxidoreductase [Kiloniellales bacterium]|nr:FAD-binding oxidoreductase [Kiloniellales bacterium]